VARRFSWCIEYCKRGGRTGVGGVWKDVIPGGDMMMCEGYRQLRASIRVISRNFQLVVEAFSQLYH
jgi:hypothetical protein